MRIELIRNAVLTLVATGLVLASGFASAQEEAAEATAGVDTAAWDAVREIASDYLPAKAVSKLQIVAYHLAGEQFCEDVHSDPEKVGETLLELRPGNWEELDEAQQAHWGQALATSFGIVLGVMIAEHADATAPFCEEVHALMNNPEVDWHLFDVDESSDERGGGED